MFTGGIKMKKATKRIIEKFPGLEESIQVSDSGEVILALDSVEETFLKLAWFFEAPEQEEFDIASLYQNLDNDWLEFALELITFYFREDTYLIQKQSFAIVKENDQDYLNLSQFAVYLTEQGLKYDRAKVKNYYDRGKIPDPDLIVGNTKYWSKSTAEFYCRQEMERLKPLG